MIEQKGDNAIISITAKPNSRKFAVEIKGDKIVVSLESRAENGRANIELIRELRRALKKEVSLIFGEKSKNKKIAVFDASKDDVEAALMRLKEINNH